MNRSPLPAPGSLLPAPGVPTVPPWPLILAAALVASIAWLGTGCAPSRATFEERGTNGTVRRMVVSSFALWPATQSIEKQKASLGKDFKFGSEGIEQSGGGTNVVEALRALDSILGKVRP